MKFSIIVPSYNQDRFIAETFENLRALKSAAEFSGYKIEILLFDNKSKESVQDIIQKSRDIFDIVQIESDKGQYDAINHGLDKITGDYWTWLNTDDKIDIEGFLRIAKILEGDRETDYIYGDIEVIDEHSKQMRVVKAIELNLEYLINHDPGIFQPGSFFKTSFTKRIGSLQNYRCCFDYEYVLRLLKEKGRVKQVDFIVAQFRLYSDSKSGSIVPVFIREQLKISSDYGRKKFSRLAFISRLRLIKRKLFN